MNMTLTERLINKYPKLYSQYNLPATQTAMCWGFECGDGWFLLLDCLSALIQQHVDDAKIQQIEAVQVKQKFGGLRFYVDYSEPTVDKIIGLFETLSYDTCEYCGSNNNVERDNKGWIISQCEKCRKENKKNEQKSSS